MIDSIERGFKFIELDLLETADHHIIAGHDWGHFAKLTGADEPQKLSLKELKALKIKGKFSVLSGEDIAKIMKKHKDFILVTDKIRNFDLLLKEIPFSNRMIVEVFSPGDYGKALSKGVKYPAFCVWSSKESAKIAMDRKFKLVTMAADFVEKEPKLVRQMKKKGIGTFAFCGSVNQPEYLKKYLGSHLSKVYIDTLPLKK